MEKDPSIAVLGRFCPIHMGHVGLIEYALEHSLHKPIIVIGSSNAAISYRNMFTYAQRRKWVADLYGDSVQICGAPDFIGIR